MECNYLKTIKEHHIKVSLDEFIMESQRESFDDVTANEKVINH